MNKSEDEYVSVIADLVIKISDLEKEIGQLRKNNQILSRQIEQWRNQAVRRYRYDQDYLDYPDDDRDR